MLILYLFFLYFAMARFKEGTRNPLLLIEATFLMNTPMENLPFQLWMALLSLLLLLKMCQVVSLPRNFLFSFAGLVFIFLFALIVMYISNVCLFILQKTF